MGPTDGIQRGAKVQYLGGPIKIPVGDGILGRVFNVVGQPIDEAGDVSATDHWPMFRDPPPLTEQSTKVEILETGIKVIDLLEPYVKGGKVRFVWWLLGLVKPF